MLAASSSALVSTPMAPCAIAGSIISIGIGAVIRSLRPEQWTKNLIIFGGLLFGQRLFDLHSVVYATAAFAVFCALSGVVYLLNDVADRDADRRHPLKRRRPIASGELSISTALVEPQVRPSGILKKCSTVAYALGAEFVGAVVAGA